VINGNFSGLCLIGIYRNCLTDMQVTEAPLSNNQSEVPLLEVTLANGQGKNLKWHFQNCHYIVSVLPPAQEGAIDF
jgi:hypothetical protein